MIGNREDHSQEKPPMEFRVATARELRQFGVFDINMPEEFLFVGAFKGKNPVACLEIMLDRKKQSAAIYKKHHSMVYLAKSPMWYFLMRKAHAVLRQKGFKTVNTNFQVSGSNLSMLLGYREKGIMGGYELDLTKPPDKAQIRQAIKGYRPMLKARHKKPNPL